MNDIVKTQQAGVPAAIQALKGNLVRAQLQMPETQGAQFLRFLQDGSWVFGAENSEARPEDQVAFNPLSLRTGWSCWTDRPGKGVKNENLGESMVPLGADPIAKHDLPVKRDSANGDKVCEWKEQISVDVRFLNGPHKGKQVLYKTTSVGGTGAMRGLIDQLLLQLDEDPANIVPVVSLQGEHYNHKAYGRTYTPKLVITKWISMDGEAMKAAPATVETDDEPAENEARSERSATREAEPVSDDGAVRRRRR